MSRMWLMIRFVHHKNEMINPICLEYRCEMSFTQSREKYQSIRTVESEAKKPRNSKTSHASIRVLSTGNETFWLSLEYREARIWDIPRYYGVKPVKPNPMVDLFRYIARRER